MPVNTPPEAQFRELVRSLLLANGFEVQSGIQEPAEEFEFIALRGDELWAVDVKYYRTARAQISLLETAAARLLTAIHMEKVRQSMLVVSARLPFSHRTALTERYGLTLLDRADLLAMTAAAPELTDKLAALLEITEPPTADPEGWSRDRLATEWLRVYSHYYRHSYLHHQFQQPKDPPHPPAGGVDMRGTELCQELRLLPKGQPGWKIYEQLCDRILQYLFSSGLHGWHSQQWTTDGLNRFDYICRIRPVAEFWRFLVDHLNSRYVLFEFKNYTGRINQGQILTTEKYLLEKGLRRVAIIFSRMGSATSALRMAEGAMREYGKLIIVLNDDDICSMLHMRQRGEDPTDFLFDKVDRFLMSLPR